MRMTQKSLTLEQLDRIEQLCQALESGEFVQAPHALRSYRNANGDLVPLDSYRTPANGFIPEVAGYCCLGVATELCVRAGAVGPEVWEGDFSLMAAEVGDWYGFVTDNPAVRIPEDPDSGHSLAEENDNNRPFPEIANAIRYTLLQEQDGLPTPDQGDEE